MTDEETARSEGSDENSNGDEVFPKSSFITTSDVLNQLNNQLSDLSMGDGRFELQKRLPDGSAIPATKDEIAAADFKTKLEQSAKFVSELESPEDRQLWAEEQRLTGNAFFQQGDYKGAMDIYLTCLVVKEDTPDFVRKTFLPILNNLAQCTLQLGMYKKTIVFCEIALEEVSKAKEKENVAKETINETEEKPEAAQRKLQDAIALCKVFFKLAKALRLTGHYPKAREALSNSLGCLKGEEEKEAIASSYATSSDANDTKVSLEPYKKAIKKEFRHLDIAEKEAKKNLSRQKRAMQKVLSSPPAAKSNSSVTQDKSDINEKSPLSDSLYEKPSGKREFSRLRARKHRTSASTLDRGQDTTNTSSDDCRELEESPSYTQYYWSMVARVAKRLLVMLGDETDVDNDRERRNLGKKNL